MSTGVSDTRKNSSPKSDNFVFFIKMHNAYFNYRYKSKLKKLNLKKIQSVSHNLSAILHKFFPFASFNHEIQPK